MSNIKIDQAPGKTGDVNEGLRNAQLQVLSRALSNLTHDVQNHLATINESAGWMKDLLQWKNKQRFGLLGRFFKRGRGPDLEPFLGHLDTIQKEVEQGSTQSQRLNNFAHRLEETRSIVDGHKVLEEIREVLLRQTGEKGIRLELKMAEEAAMIETDPPVFQLAVFDNVEQLMEGLKSGDSLTMQAGSRDGQFQVRLTSPDPGGSRGSPAEEPAGRDFSRYMVEELGGQVHRQTGDGKCVITLAFTLAEREA
jgi:two-component system NtrC family sensor kinase